MNDIEIAEKYEPIFYFHREERYYPISIEKYLSHCQMVDDKNNIVISSGNVELKHLEDNEYSKNSLVIKTKIRTITKYITIYAKISETDNYYYITYYMIFQNNKGYKILGCIKNVGEHLYDLEHVTVKVLKESESIETIFYSSHDDGEMHTINNIEFENSRPIVYIAKNSHATYNRIGTIYRIWFLANDKCEKHFKFNQTLNLLNEERDWYNFKGKLSQDGGSLMGNRHWFESPWLEKQEKKRFLKIFRCS